MFRCGNLPLHIETGRFANPKIPVEQRTCFHCPQSDENELHFLNECPFYDDLRRKMLHKAQLCNTDFVAYNTTEKLIFFYEPYKHAASTLHDMFQRRKDVI